MLFNTFTKLPENLVLNLFIYSFKIKNKNNKQ